MAIICTNNIIQHIFKYIVVQCRLYTPAKYFVSNSWNSKNMPLLQIPTTQFSTTIRELNWNKVIIFACCWPWVDRPRDRNYKICKFKNTYTQDNKQLFQIIGQIHGAMLLNMAWWKRRSAEYGVRSTECGVRSLSQLKCFFRFGGDF